MLWASNIYHWYKATEPPKTLSPNCTNRSEFEGRLSLLLSELENKGINIETASLLVAVVGEIGNNSFDHNLGQWPDASGCIFQFEIYEKQIQIVIADRGVGYLSTLKKVLPKLQTDTEALETAFEKRISGRFPEKRGNGLKFVRSAINDSNQKTLLCLSGSGSVIFGGKKSEFIDDIKNQKVSPQTHGSFIILEWEF